MRAINVRWVPLLLLVSVTVMVLTLFLLGSTRQAVLVIILIGIPMLLGMIAGTTIAKFVKR